MADLPATHRFADRHRCLIWRKGLFAFLFQWEPVIGQRRIYTLSGGVKTPILHFIPAT